MDKAVKKIEELREERNINKNVFAKSIGMSTMAYSRLSTGKTKLKVDTLIHVANFLEIEDYNFFFKNN